MQYRQNEAPLADLAAEHVYLQVNGRRLHCVVTGEGQPVLLIPGWPQTWYTWRHVMQALAAAGFQAIAVDPPGIGDSDKPAGGYDTGSVGAALHAMMAQLGHERYQLVGHDIGMWIGYAMASDFPQAVERLVLTEAVIPGLAPPPPIFVAPEENIFLWHFMFNQLADLPETLTQGREREYLGYIFNRWSYRRDRVAAEVYIAAYSAPGGLRRIRLLPGDPGDRATEPAARRHALDDASVDGRGGARHRRRAADDVAGQCARSAGRNGRRLRAFHYRGVP